MRHFSNQTKIFKLYIFLFAALNNEKQSRYLKMQKPFKALENTTYMLSAHIVYIFKTSEKTLSVFGTMKTIYFPLFPSQPF